MGKIVLAIVTLLSCISSFAQKYSGSIKGKDLIGTWQANTEVIGDAMQENFHFFANGKYIYNFNGYDDVKRILGVIGHYRFDGEQLFLTIEYRKEYTGGKLISGSPGFQKSIFVLDSGEVQMIKQKDIDPGDSYSIEVLEVSGQGEIKCIEIYRKKYYKISFDPDKYK